MNLLEIAHVYIDLVNLEKEIPEGKTPMTKVRFSDGHSLFQTVFYFPLL